MTAVPSRGLAQKGVNYDTERSVWRAEYVRRDMAAIKGDLHCNAVILLGSSLRRLSQAAELALEQGLYVWFEPRQFDKGPRRTLRFLASVAHLAEKLRRVHSGVGISVGCELTIFMDGLVPGKSWDERGANLGKPESAGYNERLSAFLVRALKTVRPVFRGQVTYTSGDWERVVWDGFDVLGVDLYRNARNAATYPQLVRALHRHGKPVVITEFGCCTFRGAAAQGGMGFTAVDWTVEPPVLKEGIVRDEQEQADYLMELLDVFEAERVHGAFVYDFISADSPTSPDPRRNMDTAAFSLVKIAPTGSKKDYSRTGHWEPKASFHALAKRFA